MAFWTPGAYAQFVDKMTAQLFYENIDQREWPKYVYFRPYGGYFRNYYLGTKLEHSSGLAPEAAGIRALVRLFYWAFYPPLLVAVLGALIWFYFHFDLYTLYGYRAKIVVGLGLISYVGIFFLIYFLGTAWLTRNLKVEKQGRALSDNASSRDFMKKHAGMSDLSIAYVDAMQKRSYVHTVMFRTVAMGWGKVIAIAVFFGLCTATSIDSMLDAPGDIKPIALTVLGATLSGLGFWMCWLKYKAARLIKGDPAFAEKVGLLKRPASRR